MSKNYLLFVDLFFLYVHYYIKHINKKLYHYGEADFSVEKRKLFVHQRDSDELTSLSEDWVLWCGKCRGLVESVSSQKSKPLTLCALAFHLSFLVFIFNAYTWQLNYK